MIARVRLLAISTTMLAIGVAACANRVSSPAVATAPEAMPTGAMGDLVRDGRDLIVHTQQRMKGYVVANLSCQDCHINAGTRERAGSLVGVYAQFPQWNERAHRIISLQDRLAECFLYSMNGRPPAYQSREMEAMVAYIAWLSSGTRVGATPDPNQGTVRYTPPSAPDPVRGAHIYTAQCSSCHGARGAGIAGAYPPLWGPHSFNDRAGMSHLWRMAGFVRYNMPANAPGTLTDQQAYDVAAYVEAQKRPHFNRNRTVTFRLDKAGYF